MTDDDGSCSVCCSTGCLRWAKIGFVIALILESLIVVPFGSWLGRRAKSFHVANALAAGAFLSTAIIHVLPHAAELLNPEEEEEELGLDTERQLRSEGGEDHDHEEGEEHDDDEGLSAGKVKNSTGGENAAEEGHGHGDEHGHGGFPTANAIVLGTIVGLVFLENVLLAKYVHVGHGHGDEEEVDEKKAMNINSDESTVQPAASDSAESGERSDVEQNLPVDSTEEKGAEAEAEGGLFNLAFFSALAIVLAVVVHVFVEAISFGLTASFSSALTIFIAIGSHRWIVASAVLLRLMRTAGIRRRQVWILFGLFVVMLPIGAAIGAALSTLSETVEGVFVAISAGAFIYLGIEGLNAEFMAHKKWKLEKFVGLFVGVAVMVILEGVLVATDNQV